MDSNKKLKSLFYELYEDLSTNDIANSLQAAGKTTVLADFFNIEKGLFSTYGISNTLVCSPV
jgi:hypothetical protein